MRMKRVGDWIHYITEGGQPFYYNDKSHEFQWDCPFAEAFGIGGGGVPKQSTMNLAAASMHKMPPGGKSGDNAAANTSNPTLADQGAKAEDSGTGNSMKGDWRPYKDPTTDGLFWYNHVTGVSQWECPYDAPAEEPNPFDDDQGEHEFVQEVHHTDDLGI